MRKFLALCCVLASAQLVFAQGATTGAIAGVVVDPDGVPLPGATVQAELLTTGTRYQAITDGSGRFNMANARVGGPYDIVVNLSGLPSTQLGNVYVALGEVTELSLQMRFEEFVGEIVVTEQNLLISPSKVGAGSNVSMESLSALPTIGRGFEDFARTNPLITVQPDQEDGPSVISVAGRNNRYNNIQIDGAVNNDLFGLAASGTPGGQSETTTISLDAIQELQLVIAPFDVRQGGFSGGGVNAITRSGTNKLRGTVYGYYRDDSMIGNGNDDFPEFGDYTDQNYGFSLGGPIVEDLAFFFVNGDISAREQPTGWSIDGTTGNAFADGTLTDEAERFRSVLAGYGHDVGTSSEYTRETDSDKLFLRLDFNLADNHHLMVRHNWIDAENTRLYPSSTTYTFPSYTYNFTNTTNSSVVQLDSVLGESMFNQLRFTYQSIDDARAPTSVFPRVNVTGVDDEGHGFVAGTERYSAQNTLDQTIIEFTDDFTWFLGDHELVIGTHNEFFQFDNLFIENAYGAYDFYSLEDLEAGIANRYYYTYSADDEPADVFDAYQLGLYVGDKWRVASNFNVVLGLRYDLPKFPDQPNRNPETEELFGYRTDEVPDGNGLFSPRAGFNWDITGEGKRQLRGGVGVFSGRSPYVWISNNYARNGLEQVTIQASGSIPFNPDPYNQPTEIPGASTSTQEVDLIDPDFEFPQILRYNLAYDHALPWMNMVASVEAVYADSLNEILYQNLNLVQNGTVFDGRPYYERVSSDYSGAYFLTNTSGGQQTNLAVKVEKPYSDGWQAYVSYTWGDSEVVNEGNSSRAVSNWQYMEAADPNNMTTSRSDFEVEHRFSASASYQFNRDSKWSTRLAAYYNHQSGRPFTVLSYSSGTSLNGDNYSYNDLFWVPESEDDVVLQGGTWEQLDAFIHRAGLDQYRGQIAPRNGSQAGPWITDLDVKVSQDIPVGFGDLELTLDIANFLNLLDSDSGHVRYMPFGNVQAVRYAGTDFETGKPIYQLYGEVRNPSANPLFEFDNTRSRWRAKLGLRWSF